MVSRAWAIVISMMTSTPYGRLYVSTSSTMRATEPGVGLDGPAIRRQSTSEPRSSTMEIASWGHNATGSSAEASKFRKVRVTIRSPVGWAPIRRPISTSGSGSISTASRRHPSTTDAQSCHSGEETFVLARLPGDRAAQGLWIGQLTCYLGTDAVTRTALVGIEVVELSQGVHGLILNQGVRQSRDVQVVPYLIPPHRKKRLDPQRFRRPVTAPAGVLPTPVPR